MRICSSSSNSMTKITPANTLSAGPGAGLLMRCCQGVVAFCNSRFRDFKINPVVCFIYVLSGSSTAVKLYFTPGGAAAQQ